MSLLLAPRPGRLVAALVIGLLAGSVAVVAPAQAAAPQAPGSFRGYGFDTCVAPPQKVMDQWNLKSPFSAVGIYISGNSRYCGDAYQPNLSRQWVATNAANGWRFIPIHVGYQAPCFTQGKSRVIKKKMSTDVATARTQAANDARESLAAAKKYGFGAKSTLFLDIEWYPRSKAACDAVVLQFIDAWTETLHAAGYLSGLYSSGSAAITSVDKARRAKTPGLDLPDQVWNAWTNKKANVDGGPYLSPDGWVKQRLHQYHNGVNVKYGGFTLNIDKNFLEVGGAKVPAEKKACGKTNLNLTKYPSLRRGAKGPAVSALQCLLRQRGLKKSVSGGFGAGTLRAVNKYRVSKGWSASGIAGRGTWTALLSEGGKPRVLKYGSTGAAVYRLQRALTAARGKPLAVTGFYDKKTVAAVKAYRAKNKLTTYSTTEATVWSLLGRGKKG